MFHILISHNIHVSVIKYLKRPTNALECMNVYLINAQNMEHTNSSYILLLLKVVRSHLNYCKCYYRGNMSEFCLLSLKRSFEMIHSSSA
jgi:hypothetical protein